MGRKQPHLETESLAGVVFATPDDVEYLITESAATAYAQGDEVIPVTRLIDRTIRPMSRQQILAAIRRHGVVDRLD